MEKEDHSTLPTRTFCLRISAKEMMSVPVRLEVVTNASCSLHLDIFYIKRSGI